MYIRTLWVGCVYFNSTKNCLTDELIIIFQEMSDVSRKEQLINLVMQIVPSQMKHHAEAEACDLLMEVERLDVLKQFVDQVH